MLRTLLIPAVALTSLTAATPARACDCGHGMSHDSAVTGRASRGTVASGAVDARNAEVVNVAVTSNGFVPARIRVKAGRPVKLVVTRKVEQTCATEIVMKDFGVDQALPLEAPVAVTITPTKPGEYRFACAMNMIGGVLYAE